MNVDLQEMDFANVVRRQLNQGPPDKGSYNMRCGLIDRSLPNVHPYGNLAIRADGKEPVNGWASSPRIEELRAAWLATADLEQQKRILRRSAEAALGRRAVHPDGRILAGDGLPERLDRCSPRMFRRVLWRAPRLNQREVAPAVYLRLTLQASPVQATAGFGAFETLAPPRENAC